MAEKSWEMLEGACRGCKKCRLWETRTNIVIGTGNKNADIMFVGEGPGRQEDLTGEPFVGDAGKLLDKMLSAINLSRNEVYIANVVKCRPPGNRDPHDDEQEACLNYLRYQLMLVKPKIVVCLGRIASRVIISPDFMITKDRGKWYDKKGYKFIATYHPSALLRDPSKKRPAWEDFKSIRKMYDSIK